MGAVRKRVAPLSRRNPHRRGPVTSRRGHGLRTSGHRRATRGQAARGASRAARRGARRVARPRGAAPRATARHLAAAAAAGGSCCRRRKRRLKPRGGRGKASGLSRRRQPTISRRASALCPLRPRARAPLGGGVGGGEGACGGCPSSGPRHLRGGGVRMRHATAITAGPPPACPPPPMPRVCVRGRGAACRTRRPVSSRTRQSRCELRACRSSASSTTPRVARASSLLPPCSSRCRRTSRLRRCVPVWQGLGCGVAVGPVVGGGRGDGVG